MSFEVLTAGRLSCSGLLHHFEPKEVAMHFVYVSGGGFVVGSVICSHVAAFNTLHYNNVLTLLFHCNHNH